MLNKDGKKRCFGNEEGEELLREYHDTEWGVPSHNDKHLFEMLTLEGAQAGLNWQMILKKRAGYRKAFHNFDIHRVASMTDAELQKLSYDEGIIRNRLKIRSVRNNARVCLDIIKEYGSFSKYVWSFVGGKPIKHHWKSLNDLPATTRESDALSKDLKKRGMSFVGSTIIYAFMQAVGLVNDHITSCWRYGK